MLRKKIENILLSKYPEVFHEMCDRLTLAVGTKYSNEKHILGRSKLGGKPDVLSNFIWPSYNGRMLSFMGQLNLSDIVKVSKELTLPKYGMLYFFMDTSDNKGYPSLVGQFKVMYCNFENKDALYEYQGNIDTTVFKEIPLSFYLHYSFKKDNEYNPEIDDIIDEVSMEICNLTGHNIEEGHQIGGYPFSLQNPVFYWWSLNEKKLAFDNLNYIQKKELETLQEEYFLLFQINFSDQNTNFSDYGGYGIAYYGIKKNDIEKQNFDNIYFVCQN